jgi:hypothetical protein
LDVIESENSLFDDIFAYVLFRIKSRTKSKFVNAKYQCETVYRREDYFALYIG